MIFITGFGTDENVIGLLASIDNNITIMIMTIDFNVS